MKKDNHAREKGGRILGGALLFLVGALVAVVFGQIKLATAFTALAVVLLFIFLGVVFVVLIAEASHPKE